MDQLGQPASVRHHLRRQPGGRGQGEHHERRGGLHGGRQDHRQRADHVQVTRRAPSGAYKHRGDDGMCVVLRLVHLLFCCRGK